MAMRREVTPAEPASATSFHCQESSVDSQTDAKWPRSYKGGGSFAPRGAGRGCGACARSRPPAAQGELPGSCSKKPLAPSRRLAWLSRRLRPQAATQAPGGAPTSFPPPRPSQPDATWFSRNVTSAFTTCQTFLALVGWTKSWSAAMTVILK